jgi:hypothetical protein
MKPRPPIVLFLLVCLSFAASAQEPISLNQWVSMVSSAEKTSLPGDSIQSPEYFAWAPVKGFNVGSVDHSPLHLFAR